MKHPCSYSARSIIAGLLALLPVACAFAESVEDYFAEAEKAFDQSDIVNAMANYRKAAEAGYVPAQNRLAYLLNISEQNEEALEWYRKAAAAGDAEAEFNLAGMYAEGDGTAKDTLQAITLFTSSANQGYAPAIHVMAAAYEEGEMGLRIDYDPMGAAVADFDGDGWLDLYILYQHGPNPPDDMPWIDDNQSGVLNQLWRNTGRGKFENVTYKTEAGGDFRLAPALTKHSRC